MKRDILDDVFENSIRVDKIIWIGGALSSVPDDLEEFIENDEDEAKRLLGVDPEEFDGCLEDYIQEVVMKGNDGFLIYAATPVPSFVGPDSSVVQMSWGYTTMKWHFIPKDQFTIKKMVTVLVQWRSEIEKHFLSKAKWPVAKKGTSNE
jgi:hypothetical protein